MASGEQLRHEFDDDTGYERLVLERILEPTDPPPGLRVATDDIRGGGPVSMGRQTYDSLCADVLERFAAQFRPLAFGAAYKILDFAVEMTMQLNGIQPAGGRGWPFSTKVAFAASSAPTLLPAPLDTAREYWIRAARLYVGLEEYRHALMHRRTHVAPNGDLAGTDRVGAALSQIAVAELDALSRFATLLADALIHGTADKRQLNAMAWQLDLLEALHRCGLLGAAQPPAAIRVVIDNVDAGPAGGWTLDGRRLHSHLRTQGAQPSDADAELHAFIDGRNVVFDAAIDDVPDTAIEIDPAALPAWLRLRPGAAA